MLPLPALGQGAFPLRGWRQQRPRWAPLVCPCQRHHHPACARPCSGCQGSSIHRPPERWRKACQNGMGVGAAALGGGWRLGCSVSGRSGERAEPRCICRPSWWTRRTWTWAWEGPGQDSSGRNLSLQRTGLLCRDGARAQRWVLEIKDSAWDTSECETCIRHPGRAARWVDGAEKRAFQKVGNEDLGGGSRWTTQGCPGQGPAEEAANQ